MPIVNERVRDQLRMRFDSRLSEPVAMQLYTRPSAGRLILPAGVGCPTCADAQEIAEALRDAAPTKISLEVVDVSRDGEHPAPQGTADAPTLAIGRSGEEARIRFQGLPAGTEFAALIDAVERVSNADVGLDEASLKDLAKVTEPLELMVFATPT